MASALIHSHMDVLAATDFFTAEVWTKSGLVTYYVLFFMHLAAARPYCRHHALSRRPVDDAGGPESDVTAEETGDGDFNIQNTSEPVEGGTVIVVIDNVELLIEPGESAETTPRGALVLLREDVLNLELYKGIQKSLLAKLNSADRSLSKGKDQAATGSLGAFINQVEAQSGKKIAAPDADALIVGAEGVITLIGTT